MFVIKRSKLGYAQDPTKYLNFSKFKDCCSDDVALVEGAFEKAAQWEQFDYTDSELKKILKKKILRLEFEEPNKFYLGDNPDEYDHYFYKIFTIDPYTAEWLNTVQGTELRIPIFFPFNEDYIPSKKEKKYDVIYTGHIVSNKLLEDLKTISKFNHRFVSNSKHPLVTDQGSSYEEKLDLIAKSKITLVHNLQYPKLYHLFFLWRVKEYRKNKGFKLIPEWYTPWKWFSKSIVVPQLKSRTFEAAFCRSLILCKKDPFNVIERYFDPEKEFVYYTEGHLEEKIREILQNYPKYKHVIDQAYDRAINNYTVKKFVDNYVKKIS